MWRHFKKRKINETRGKLSSSWGFQEKEEGKIPKKLDQHKKTKPTDTLTAYLQEKYDSQVGGQNQISVYPPRQKANSYQYLNYTCQSANTSISKPAQRQAKSR